MQDIQIFIQQHPVLSAGLAITIVLSAIVEFIRLRRRASQLSPVKTVALMNHEQAVVIDVRDPAAWAAGHIASSVSIPAAELEKQVEKIEKYRARPVILVCANGTDSINAVTRLKQRGIDAQLLAGGMRAWRDAELPVIK